MGHMQTGKSQISLCIHMLDQGHFFPYTESLDTIEYIDV